MMESWAFCDLESAVDVDLNVLRCRADILWTKGSGVVCACLCMLGNVSMRVRVCSPLFSLFFCCASLFASSSYRGHARALTYTHSRRAKRKTPFLPVLVPGAKPARHSHHQAHLIRCLLPWTCIIIDNNRSMLLPPRRPRRRLVQSTH